MNNSKEWNRPLTLEPKAAQKADGKTWCDMSIPVTAMYEYILANDYGLNLRKINKFIYL